MVIDEEEGQYALTLFDVLERAHKQMAFVAFWPRTGRTHQIRVHAAHMGCPILGDGKYGGQDAFIEGMEHEKRLHLHAHSLRFMHPGIRQLIEIEAPLPDDLKKSWKSFGFSYDKVSPAFDDVKLLKK